MERMGIAFHDLWADDKLTDIHTIAIPKIGAGRGGLKWEFVEELLREIEETYSIEFWVYDL